MYPTLLVRFADLLVVGLWVYFQYGVMTHGDVHTAQPLSLSVCVVAVAVEENSFGMSEFSSTNNAALEAVSLLTAAESLCWSGGLVRLSGDSEPHQRKQPLADRLKITAIDFPVAAPQKL